jgi:hypothetical protein
MSHKYRTSCVQDGQPETFRSLWENTTQIALTIADIED